MPMVLHCIVSPTGEKAGDEGPLVAVDAVGCEEPLFLFFSEWPPVDSWV